jgi:ABC-type Fe3+/spermidine/putrescine transport system ATPase subunit
MRDGRIERSDVPREIYNDPHTAFVCTFVGDANVFDVKVESVVGSETRLRLGNSRICVDRPTVAQSELQIAVRPEDISVWPKEQAVGENILNGVIQDAIFKGHTVIYETRVGDKEVLVLSLPHVGDRIYNRGDEVALAFSRRSVILLGRQGAAHG